MIANVLLALFVAVTAVVSFGLGVLRARESYQKRKALVAETSPNDPRTGE